MSTGWIVFILFIVVGFVDLGMGFVYFRGSTPTVGALPPVAGEPTPQSTRTLGLVMLISAPAMWGLACAFASGAFGPDLALPLFAGATT
jgi:hypothetical protein